MGTTIFSPLMNGLLTGKYNDGIAPEDSRMTTTDNPFVQNIFHEFLVKRKDEVLPALKKFGELAKELGCSMAQLALAWCINNPDISTAITGASSPGQLEETMKAVKFRKLLTP